MEKKKELHQTRLATTDEHGHRITIYPEDVKGKWKTRRTFFYWLLILFYLILPWIYVNGKQWVLIDIPKREFTLFGTIFYAHDTPLLIFLLVGFLLAIAFITGRWGRLWCGWACPQTVFIDVIYRQIERLVEGSARQRKQLESAPLSFSKISKRGIKWFLYLLVSLHIVHSFLGYFVGTHHLLQISFQSPLLNFPLFLTMLTLTALVLFDFGWFREQFCIIVCPYGRFQSVLMDENSMVVGYDYNRGEPRRNIGVVPKEKEGDCIDCFHCVKACPTGIDIRRGTQMECIACTMCIDACDSIMEKLKRPPGLIRYTSQNQLEGKKKKNFSVRSAVYLLLMALTVLGLVLGLERREELQLQLVRASKMPYMMASEQTVANHFKLMVGHNSDEELSIVVKIGHPQVKVIMPISPFKLKRGMNQIDLFFQFDKNLLNQGKLDQHIQIIDAENNSVLSDQEIHLVGPYR